MMMDRGELLLRLGDDEVVILDVRDPQTWAEFELHIPGALRFSLDDISEHAHILPDDELIVVCGFAADGVDANRAHRLLRLRGRDPVILDGGLRGWVTAGFPTERHGRSGGERAGPVHHGPR